MAKSREFFISGGCRRVAGFAVILVAIAGQAFASSTPAASLTTVNTNGPVSCGQTDAYLDGGVSVLLTCTSTISSSSALPVIANMVNGQATESGGIYQLTGNVSGTGPTQNPYGTILGFFGYGQQGNNNYPSAPLNYTGGALPFTQGPQIVVNDNASVTADGATAYQVGYGFNTGGVVVGASYGAEGFTDTNGNTDHKVSNVNFSGTQGGSVTITLGSSASITAIGNGAAVTDNDNDPPPTLSGIGAFSFGGNGITGKENSTPYAGFGGDGGNLQVNDDGAIAMSNTNNTPTYGIYAVSQGGLSVTETDELAGEAGNGGSINVYLAGPLSDNAPNGIGIVAQSIGGNSDFDDKNDGGLASAAGNGGNIYTEIQNGGQISMSGQTSIGVMAVSVAGDADNIYEGNGGNVTVQVDQGGSITTSGNGNSLSLGVLAISAGSIGDIAPADASNVNLAYPGNPGDVTITNNGSITTSGSMAIGVAALSIGGTSIVTNATTGGSSILGDSGANSSGFAGQTATVSNGGTIITLGDSAYGIVAMSVGGGGGLLNLESADQPVAYVGSSTNASAGGNGANVTVTNSGIVSTGDSSGGGNAAIGVVAQSIGGGGGDSGAPAFFVGGNDTSGEGGGNGGAVTYTSNPGSQVDTFDTNALGVLAQSIGGGGGNGANAAGIFVALGGTGGLGGAGGAVTVNLDNQGEGGITTLGDFSAGILAQSIGGGGGNGGGATTFSPEVSISIGGAGGNGGTGGAVNLSNDGTIITEGNQAHGMVAQSIGGGGGTGGAANAYSAGVFTVSVAVGGGGGGGQSGGAVTVDNDYHIYTGCLTPASGCGYAETGAPTTDGDDSIGILAQSIGGGGGNGGAATAKSLTFPTADTVPVEISFDFTVGGSGGSGGDGNTITINNAGQVVTGGDGAYGVVAQSVGGGGGNGGDSTASAYAIEGTAPTLKVAVAVGGKGGSAGYGGSVNLTNGAYSGCTLCNAQVVTYGENATGILAQSIGGGGGTGAVGNAADSSPNIGGDPTQDNGSGGYKSTGDSYDATVGVGGNGGAGNNGGTVTVTNEAGSLIETLGSDAQAILAQSIGGGGGLAGGSSGGASGDTYMINVSVGGSGGAGNTGGTVTVDNAGTIETGSDILTTAMIGTAPVSKEFSTGGNSVGILAQSIGGGGGVAGSSDASASVGTADQIEDALNAPSNSYGAEISVGGDGGTGGNAGAVNVTNTGTIQTRGIEAYGIEAQSIGGGGGSGGDASSAASSVLGGLTDAPAEAADKDVAEDLEKATTDAGGEAANAAEGKTNSGTFDATISVGGSGGAAGTGGTLTVDGAGGSILTAGYAADGILAQSIGGGGGVAGDGTTDNTATIGLGGSGSEASGNGSNSGSVTVTSGAVTTLGDDALGILAQSIGGGGGTAGGSCSNSSSTALQGITTSLCYGNYGLTANTAPWNDATDLSLNIGGSSGTTGSADPANVEVSGAIVTYGARAMGVVAQSIGGGGGYVGAAAVNIVGTGIASQPTDTTGDTVGVTLDAGASITTYGAGAWGILAQSIGGGGGFDGDSSLALAMPESNTVTGGSGNAFGNTVTVNVNGNIATTGVRADGVVAQSIGGGGGLVGGNANSTSANILAGNNVQFRNISASIAGNGGTINITQAAGSTIDTSGLGAIGIFAQSSGVSATTYPITVDISGAVIGGTNGNAAPVGAGAAGILLSGGSSASSSNPNSINVDAGGSISTADGNAGTAILTNDGQTSVSNAGTITGSIILDTAGAAAGAITDEIGNTGTLNTGTMLQTTTLQNNATVNIGLPGTIQTTSLTGSFDQYSGATLGVTIDSVHNAASLLQVSGGTSLSGAVVPDAITLLPGSPIILSSTEGLLFSATVPSSLLFSWQLGQTNLPGGAAAISITPVQNFQHPNGATESLNANQSAVAGYLADAWNHIAAANNEAALTGAANANGSDATLATLFANLSKIPEGGFNAYLAALDARSPQATQGELTALKSSEGSILGASMSCPVFSNATTLLGEDSCVWVKFGGQSISQYATDGQPGFSTTGNTYRLGAQKEFSPDWYIGGSFGAGQSWTRQGPSDSNGPTYDGSLALKHQIGPFLLAGSFAVASGAYSNTRVADNTALTSDSSALMIGGRLRAAYDIPRDNWYLRPYADLDILNISSPSFQESGPGGYALRVNASNSTNVVISPMAELGGRFNTGNAWILRYYADTGVSFLPGNSRTIDASLVGTNPAFGTFATTIHSPDMLGNIDVGLQLYRTGGFEMKVDYNTQVGGTFFAQGGSLRLAYHF